jgi:hypothetical protein
MAKAWQNGTARAEHANCDWLVRISGEGGRSCNNRTRSHSYDRLEFKSHLRRTQVLNSAPSSSLLC